MSFVVLAGCNQFIALLGDKDKETGASDIRKLNQKVIISITGYDKIKEAVWMALDQKEEMTYHQVVEVVQSVLEGMQEQIKKEKEADKDLDTKACIGVAGLEDEILKFTLIEQFEEVSVQKKDFVQPSDFQLGCLAHGKYLLFAYFMRKFDESGQVFDILKIEELFKNTLENGSSVDHSIGQEHEMQFLVNQKEIEKAMERMKKTDLDS